jgi:hypothetical protein
MPAGNNEQPSAWKNRREWLTAIVASLGLCVSVGGYLISRSSDKSGKSLILVAGKADNIAGNQGLSFVFHPLNPNQKISRIDIVFPPSISTGVQSAQPFTQELDLAVVTHMVERYRSTHQPPPAGTTTVWDGSIPIVLEAQYIAADENLVHRGLYKLRTRILWTPSGPPRIRFLDVLFDHMLSANTNYAEALTFALGDEEAAERKRFNPTR